jgi:D-3-phosphoglycerate dehydrogenase
MFKVAITDYTFGSLEVEQGILQSAGGKIASGQCRTPEALIPLVADADAVITQFAPVNADVIAEMRKAKAIVRYGIGYDNVDCDAARAKGIPVCNIPDYCIDEVADHTLAFILATTRALRPNCAHIVNGAWGLGVPLEHMRALADQSIGIIGLGRIGKAVANRLRAFKCQLLAFDPVISADEASTYGCSLISLDELLSTSDIVTLHCPSNDKTRGLISADTLAQMKPASILINVGRGDLVQLDALTKALNSGHLAAAALDVFDQEPLDNDSPLPKMDNVIVSSHVASASPKSILALRETAGNLALKAVRGEPLPNVVNGVS